MRVHQRFKVALHPHRIASALPSGRMVVLGCASTVRLYGDTGQFVKGAEQVHRGVLLLVDRTPSLARVGLVF